MVVQGAAASGMHGLLVTHPWLEAGWLNPRGSAPRWPIQTHPVYSWVGQVNYSARVVVPRTACVPMSPSTILSNPAVHSLPVHSGEHYRMQVDASDECTGAAVMYPATLVTNERRVEIRRPPAHVLVQRPATAAVYPQAQHRAAHAGCVYLYACMHGIQPSHRLPFPRCI